MRQILAVLVRISAMRTQPNVKNMLHTEWTIAENVRKRVADARLNVERWLRNARI